MIADALARLRARWHALIGSVIALVLALLWARRAGRIAERERTTAANGKALGDELRADDAIDARDRERAQIEADARARLDRRKREILDRPPRWTADARREASERLERAARAADEDR